MSLEGLAQYPPIVARLAHYLPPMDYVALVRASRAIWLAQRRFPQLLGIQHVLSTAIKRGLTTCYGNVLGTAIYDYVKQLRVGGITYDDYTKTSFIHHVLNDTLTDFTASSYFLNILCEDYPRYKGNFLSGPLDMIKDIGEPLKLLEKTLVTNHFKFELTHFRYWESDECGKEATEFRHDKQDGLVRIFFPLTNDVGLFASKYSKKLFRRVYFNGRGVNISKNE